MSRALWVSVFAGMLAAIQPVQAQPPGKEFGKDNLKRVEAELDRLRNQVQELEGALKKVRDGGPERQAKKGDGPGAERKPAGKDNPRPEDGGPRFAQKKEGFGRGPDFGEKKDGKGPWGDGPPFAKKKDGKGPGPWGDGPPFAKKKDGKGPGPWGDGPAFAKKKDGKGPGPWGDGPAFAKGPWAGGGLAKGRPGGPPGFGAGPPWARGTASDGAPSRGRSEDLERRLDRILSELEDLRRELRRR